MKRDRLAGFTDGVIAVIITTMVLDLRAPASTAPAAPIQRAPVFSSHVLSFLYIAI